jgi:hypothetical protein
MTKQEAVEVQSNIRWPPPAISLILYLCLLLYTNQHRILTYSNLKPTSRRRTDHCNSSDLTSCLSITTILKIAYSVGLPASSCVIPHRLRLAFQRGLKPSSSATISHITT